jgi:membrane protease YdiL (CAAX protease family)
MRLGLEKGLKNKKVFAVFSGLIFGIIHVVDSLIVIFVLPLIGLLIDYIINLKKSKLFTTTCIITVLLFVGISVCVYLNYVHIDIKEAIYSISYISMGVYFALMYLKYKNIFYTIIPHMIVNTIATIFLFFI